jgi:uncharacterized protein YndB with AHSA1/START domain
MTELETRAVLPPVRKSVTVARTGDEAFDIFTRGIARWWPMRPHSVSQERATSCALEPRVGGRVYETRDDGATFEWGRVTAWDPPHRLVLAWYPGREPSTAQEVEITFTAVPGGTRVDLVHRGWEAAGAGARDLREGYDRGWELVFVLAFAKGCAAR